MAQDQLLAAQNVNSLDLDELKLFEQVACDRRQNGRQGIPRQHAFLGFPVQRGGDLSERDICGEERGGRIPEQFVYPLGARFDMRPLHQRTGVNVIDGH